MWSSKNDQQDDGDQASRDDASSTANQSRRSLRNRDEPNERTRLLDRLRPPNSDGYLDPDDPAVSPYNLWSVRILRFFTVLFLMISCLWWTLLLISIFVSPPGMHSRGSGFFDFAYTCLTIGNLLVAVLFFSAPAKALRITTAIITGLLLIDMIIILAVPKIRLEEGWVGVASVIWAVFIAAWCVLTDRVVAWGKREEEERLTGRPETRRTLKEWLAILIATILTIVFAVIALLMTSALSIRARDATLEMAGDRILVDGDKYAVHFACVGSTSASLSGNATLMPTVLLEAGEEPSEYDLEHWAYNAIENGTITRYCYWDRPGYAWSDNAPSPHSAGMSADALSEALAKEGEEGPWILVSAGTGTIVSRIFGSRHTKQVVGMMLVEGIHEDLLHRLSSPGRGLALWAWGVISPLGIERLIGALFKGHTRQDRVYGRSAHQSGKFIKAELQESLVADGLSKNEVVSARNIQSADTPLVIISSAIKCKSDAEWERKQEDLTKLTEKLVSWDVVRKAPHQVWQTWEGRQVMEKRLGQLVKEAGKLKLARDTSEEEEE